jgi:hypothetical protein
MLAVRRIHPPCIAGAQFRHAFQSSRRLTCCDGGATRHPHNRCPPILSCESLRLDFQLSQPTNDRAPSCWQRITGNIEVPTGSLRLAGNASAGVDNTSVARSRSAPCNCLRSRHSTIQPMPRPRHDRPLTRPPSARRPSAQLSGPLEDSANDCDDARCGGCPDRGQRPDHDGCNCGTIGASGSLAAMRCAGQGQVVDRWPTGRYDR